jgi:hypothetical protein
MPRYFSLIWLFCIISAILLIAGKFGIAAVSVNFLLPVIAIGFLLSILVVLIIDFAARIIGCKYDPFASRFDWRDED